MAHGRRVAVLNQVLTPEFQGVHAQFPGDEVDLGLGGEDGLRVAGRAHAAAGHLVGVDHVRVDVPVGYLVGPQTPRAVGHATLGFEGRVAAAVVDQVRLAGRDGAVFLDSSFKSHHCRMARVAGHQFFDVGHGHAHGPAGGLGEPEAQVGVHEPALAAEIPADGRRIDPYLVGGHVDAFRELLAHLEGHLAVDPSLHPAAVVQEDHRGMGFDVGLMLVVGLEGMLEYQISLGEPLFHVAVRPYAVARRVGIRLGAVWDADVISKVGMEHGRAGFDGV